MRKSIISAAVLILLAMAPQVSADSTNVAKPETQTRPTTIQWVGFDEGIARAKSEQKHVLIDFYTSWCGFCKKMDVTTFRDREVIDYINEMYLPIKVDGESRAIITHKGEKMTQRELTSQFSVRGFPTYWFLESDGRQIGPAPGYRSPKDFLTMLQYIAEDHYKTMSFKSFTDMKKSGSG